MRSRWATRGFAVAVTVLVLSAAACGGGGSKTTTSTASGGTSAEAWAGGVCSSVTTWKKSVQSIEASVAAQPSKSAIQQAAQQFESATKTLANSLKGLGKPDTAQGQAAKQNIDSLANSLETGMNKIKQTLKSSSSGAAGALASVSTLTGTLSSMANDLKIAGSNLKNFAPSGELQQAFRNANACKPYFKS